eukprot:COSAG06_NODE_1867_length_8190_cov_5.401681_5_plen_89_part_00
MKQPEYYSDPTTHIYIKAHYSACPTLRYYDGCFYLITVLENLPNPKGPKCNSKSAAGWSSCLAEHMRGARIFRHGRSPRPPNVREMRI